MELPTTGIHVRPTAIARHRAAPLCEEREQFLANRAAQGIHRGYLKQLASTLLHVVRILDLNEPRGVSVAEVEKAGELWAADTERLHHGKTAKHSKSMFVIAATSFLNFHGLVLETSLHPFKRELDQYLRMITDEWGVSASTIRASRGHITRFLIWIAERHAALSEITIPDVSEYLTYKKTTCTIRSLVTCTRPLKSFFAYGEVQGWCISNLGHLISFANIRRHDPDKLIPSWEEVRRLLDTETRQRPSDHRNQAMLFLCSIYGLRSSEVVRLRLSDIDWREETLTVTRSKNGRTQVFPLQFEVGEAILLYLVHGRPKCSCRHLFVSVSHPIRPIRPATLATVTANRMSLLGIRSSSKGPHSLRHACATQLLRTGSSLRQIADFLGHRGLTSVSIYARLDDEALREVAAFSLRGVL
jgi:integrase/recombinase XerD